MIPSNDNPNSKPSFVEDIEEFNISSFAMSSSLTTVVLTEQIYRAYTIMNNILAAKVLISHLPEITDGSYKTAIEIAIETLFMDAMDDDLNTADAIGYLFEMTRDINTTIAGGASKEYIDAVMDIYVPLCDLLGFGKEEETGDVAYIEEMISKRAEAKKAKNYAEADAIREELKQQGIILEDTPQGVKWKRA